MELTPEQVLEAQAEGWKLRAGYPTRILNNTGLSDVFSSTFEVVKFVRERGKVSEWHREVFLSLPWGPVHDEMAMAEKWWLNHTDLLSRDRTLFGSSEDAQEFVRAGAEAGDPLHQKAIMVLAKRRLSNADRKSPWHQ